MFRVIFLTKREVGLDRTRKDKPQINKWQWSPTDTRPWVVFLGRMKKKTHYYCYYRFILYLKDVLF